MGRVKRFFQDWMVYHVIVRCNNKQMLLQAHKTKMLFIQTFGNYQKQLGFKAYGFVIMDNHAHMLIQIQGSANLSVLMQRALLSFGKKFRKNNNYIGHFWQGRFKTHHVISDAGMLEVLKYIHNNPVKAKIVNKIEHYPYSSAYKYMNISNNDMDQRITISVYGDTSGGSCDLIRI